ncbi:MAG: hypothetical protein K1W00_01925 [Lachnospiraceae bacterium]
MYGYICSICESNYDPGELTGGICDECREAVRQSYTRLSQLQQKRDSLLIKTKGQVPIAIGEK